MSRPLVGPVNHGGDLCYSIKDPSVVRYEGRWHLFCTIRSKERTHQIEYVSFADWKDADSAERHLLNLTDGYYCAPQVFFFSPHKKWYLIYQVQDPLRSPSLQPAYSTSDDLSDPKSWSEPKLLFDEHPANVKMWIDFWVICDQEKAHLFFTSHAGWMWRSETQLSDFPSGWSKPEVVLKGDIFEASHTYRVKGANSYLTLIEARDRGRRYFKAFKADRLAGEWSLVGDAPFVSLLNVAYLVPNWTDSFSHGEFLRAGYDETLEIDPDNLRILFQGVKTGTEPDQNYGTIPWRLGILEAREKGVRSILCEAPSGPFRQNAPDPFFSVDDKTICSARGSNTEQLRWTSWPVESLEGKDACIEIIDDASGGWGHVLVDQIEFSDESRSGAVVALTEAADFGTMVLACTPAEVSPRGDTPVAASKEHFVEEGERTIPLSGKLVGRLRSTEVAFAPGEKHSATFVLAWHFPNAAHGNAYAVRFQDAEAVAKYVLDEHDRLAGQTRLWRDTYYDSTLPYWLLDHLHSTVSTLATGTCQRWADGRFYAYEGVTCCGGTCTHVWNYAHAHARLFPAMTRTIRTMQDLCPREQGGGFHPDSGLVGFRSNDAYAADGQCGTILKALREHQMSSNDTFLRQFWPRIKKALEYSMSQDGNPDGLIENTQHNTYDINYEGANTFVGSLYLAALRAGEEMAREMGDIPFAERCRAIFESGTRLSQERLWNGEYFIQDVDLQKHPKHQYAEGCLSDHLFGQGWACQLGLGDIYPNKMVRSALRAIWKYNWAPDVTPYNEVHKPFRWFITAGQAGLFTCTWPKSEYLPEGTVYKNEVWTGIEYQVAGHMIAEGMVTEGLAICRAIHDRYQPNLINPYNEVECGDHYARAMASWGVYLALAGFEYHGSQPRYSHNVNISCRV